MNGNINGGMIDTTSVMMIINKLNLFIENEERTITEIEKTLSRLSEYYNSDNNKVIDDKVNNLKLSLSTMLDNRRRYVEVIKTSLERYVTQNENVTSIFNDL